MYNNVFSIIDLMISENNTRKFVLATMDKQVKK